MTKAKIEGIYPLSFMQNSLLIHSLYESVDQGFLQVQCFLKGTLDRDLLEQSWQEITQLHAVCRTSLHWENIEKPVQVIHPQAKMPWEFHDWRALNEAAQEERLATFKLADRELGLPLSKAPVSRLSLIQLSSQRHALIWSCHHILFDGWSGGIIFQDVFKCYDALSKGSSFQPDIVPTYRSYLDWLKQQNLAAAKAFWKDYLDQYHQPSLIGAGSSTIPRSDFKDHILLFSVEKTQELKSYVSHNRVTLSTFLLMVWGLILGRICRSNDVVFGTTVSGRSGDFPQVERMTGPLMNVLPARLLLNPEQSLLDCLTSIQSQQTTVRNFEYINQGQINSWIKWPGHLPLFDSLVVIQNLAWDQIKSGGIVVEGAKGKLTSNYPLTIVVKPGDQLELILRFDTHQISAKLVDWISQQLQTLLGTANSNLESVKDLSGLIKKIPLSLGSQSVEERFNVGKRSETSHVDDATEYNAPGNALELKLTKIWEGLFGFHPIGVNDNFFHIGGTSLLAVQLLGRIEQETGRKISPALLLKNPTIKYMAQDWGHEAVSSAWSSLVPMRAGGSKPPLFVIHGGGGHVFFYYPLTKYLDPDQPVYALQPLGLDREQGTHHSIENMASHYMEVIRNVYPEGPFFLLGTCFSDPVCVEMSILIKNQGESMIGLIIVDSAPFHLFPRKRLHISTLESRIQKFKERFRRSPYKAIKKTLVDRVKKLLHNPTEKWAYYRIRYGSNFHERNLLLVQENLAKLYYKYPWKPFDGKVTLIQTRQNIERVNNYDDEVWQKLARGGVDLLEIPGQHRTRFVEPDVIGLAKCLQKHLDDNAMPSI